jgi:hypothetical protein
VTAFVVEEEAMARWRRQPERDAEEGAGSLVESPLMPPSADSVVRSSFASTRNGFHQRFSGRIMRKLEKKPSTLELGFQKTTTFHGNFKKLPIYPLTVTKNIDTLFDH